MHLNNLQDARRRIDERRFGRHEEEIRRRQEYEQEYSNPDLALEPLNAGNAADNGAETLKGPQHSLGCSEDFSGPVVLKSLGSSRTRER